MTFQNAILMTATQYSMKNIKFSIGYPTCCRKCNNRKDSPRTQHARATNYERFGSYTNIGTEQLKQQAIEGFLRNYGATNNMKSETGKAEYCTAIYEKYGVNWITQSSEVQSKMKSKFKYDGRKFDSGLELAFYIFFNDNHIKFRYNDFDGIEYTFNNKTYLYFRDFEIEVNGITYLIELKGSHFFNFDGTMCNPYDHSQDELYEAKHQCMLKNKVNIITDSSLCVKVVYDYIDKKYGEGYLQQFKNCNQKSK